MRVIVNLVVVYGSLFALELPAPFPLLAVFAALGVLLFNAAWTQAKREVEEEVATGRIGVGP